MLGLIARVLIGTVLGALFLVGMALAYANDLLTRQPRPQSRQRRGTPWTASPDSVKQISFIDETQS